MAHTAHLVPHPIHHATPGPVSFRSLLASRPESVASRRSLTTILSVVVHALLITAIVIVPLFMSHALPPPSETLRAFLVSPPQVALPPPPPPPPAPVAAVRRATAPSLPQVARFVAPIETPEEIVGDEPLELGIEGGIPGGVEGGVSGGVVGGIVGGLAQVAMPASPQVVRVGKTIRAPRLLRKVPPEYPAVALKARLSGTVVLDAHVDVRGQVKDVKVLSGHPWFGDAAIAAVKQWRYMPLLLNGEPREFLLSVTVVFNLAVLQQ